MTLEQIQKLTDDELRVRVAEAVGTHTVTVLPFDGGTMTHVTDERGRIRAIRQMDDGPRAEQYPRDWIAPPNYPADLNACRSDFETGERMNRNQRNRYLNTLYNLTWSEDNDEVDDDFAWLTATARARCEAFLAVMGRE